MGIRLWRRWRRSTYAALHARLKGREVPRLSRRVIEPRARPPELIAEAKALVLGRDLGQPRILQEGVFGIVRGVVSAVMQNPGRREKPVCVLRIARTAKQE